MKRKYLSVFSLLLAAGASGIYAPEISAQGSRVTRAPAMRIPFARLQALPDRFESVSITALGFLAIDRGKIKIYPSRESYNLDDQSSALTVIASFEELNLISGRFGRKYVLFTGVFHQIQRDGRAAALGELRGFRVIAPAEGEARLKDESSNKVYRTVD